MYLLPLFAYPLAVSAVSLIEALNGAGASIFAQEIQSDPELLALYNSPSVRTVYAVPDTSYHNGTLRRRQSDPAEARKKRSQACKNQSDMEQQALGEVNESNENSPKTGKPNPAVSQNSTSPGSKLRRQATSNNATFLPPVPIKISTGLGNKVNLIRGDIPYDGGLIHIVDDYFTIPVSVSETINSTGLSTLQTLLTRANLSDTFENANTVTIFTPSDAAFAAAGTSTNVTTSELQKLLLNHIVPDFAGYLPLLKDGATYTTLAGTKLTISIRNGQYFVNGVKITSANTITDNGVAHVINGVLIPTPPPFTGAGWTLKPTSSLVALAAAILFLYI
jgi:uncharacterized surface protein with fasciclin (FAS1) repeats